MVNWNILRPIGIFYSHLVYIVVIWYIFSFFGILNQETSGNLGYKAGIKRTALFTEFSFFDKIECCVRKKRLQLLPLNDLWTGMELDTMKKRNFFYTHSFLFVLPKLASLVFNQSLSTGGNQKIRRKQKIISWAVCDTGSDLIGYCGALFVRTVMKCNKQVLGKLFGSGVQLGPGRARTFTT
jgi:hypothetical protein